MRVHICAIGRARQSPEAELVNDYLTRFDRTGRGLGLALGGLHEGEPRKGADRAQEAAILRKTIPSHATVFVMDERGARLSSPEFATQLAKTRDQGAGDLAICIGGADGFDPAFRNGADFALSFGAMVWPHMLARVMLSEQLYRAASILAGLPYHRV
jgi:23S rRNA (pseudouridine1915-N3)-methyltransferase